MLLTSLPLAGTAFAERENTTVLEATDNVGAALAWSALFDSADAVAIGRDDNFADSLSSGLIQGLGDGVPLLLTPTDALDADVADEIDRLGATTAHIMGGESAVSAAVADELEDMGLTIHRHAGASRVETAVDVASKHAADATTAIVARASASGADATQAFADALAAGAWAAEAGYPILLTQSNALHPAVANHLATSDIADVFVVGGTAAVSDGVVSEIEALGIDVTRVSGATRFDTAVAIAAERGFADAGDAADGVVVVDGQDADAWADGFASAAFASNPKPVVLSNGDDLPDATSDFLGAVSGGLDLFIGSSVSSAAGDAAADAVGNAEIPTTNQTFTVTPSDSVEVDNATTRQFSVTGITSARVDIALFNCSNVASTGSTYTFTGTTTAADVDTAVPGALNGSTITVVNGVAGGSTDQVVPQNGAVSFTVTGPAATTVGGCVEPIIYGDADDDDLLDIGANNQPTELFGAGGETSFIPAAAGSANPIPAASTVTRTNKGSNKFSAGTGGVFRTYAYDANDLFSVGGVSVGIDAFEAALSGDDTLGGAPSSYTTDPAGVSNFNLTDAGPVQPATLTVSGTPTSTAITLTWPDSATATADAYRIFRLQSTGPAVACPDTTAADGTSLVTAEVPARTYVAIATVADASGSSAADPAYTYTDPGLTANTRYCYFIRSVDDGDESFNRGVDLDTPQTANTAVAASNPGAPKITDVRAVDNGLSGNADSGDFHQFIFDQPMAATVDDAVTSSTYRLQDADASPTIVDIVCGVNATCVLEGAGTFNGVAYAAGRVMRVQLTGAPTVIQAGTAVGLQYPATITSVSTGNWKDADEGLTLDLPGSPDKSVDVAAVTPATETTVPTIVSAAGVDGGAGDDTVTVTLSEAVVCSGGSPGQWLYDADGAAGGEVAATSVVCNGTTSVVLKFPTGTFTAGSATDTIQYTQGSATDRTYDINGNALATVGTPGPAITG